MRRVSLHRDRSEPDIIEALEAHGYSVLKVNTRNAPDLVICKGRFIALAEVKTGKAKLKPGQAAFAQRWPQEVFILRSPECVLKLAKAEGRS